MGVDGLAGDAGRGGELFHAGIGSVAEDGAGRVHDQFNAPPGVGPAASWGHAFTCRRHTVDDTRTPSLDIL